jgi:hypothetical protein
MSISNTDLVKDTLGLIGVLADNDAPSAEQGMLGLRVLNEMMASWTVDSIDVGYYPQDALSADAALPDEQIECVKHNLGVLLCPYFGREPSPIVVAVASATKSRLLRDAMQNEMVPASMRHIPRGEARRWNQWRYDINKDS